MERYIHFALQLIFSRLSQLIRQMNRINAILTNVICLSISLILVSVFGSFNSFVDVWFTLKYLKCSWDFFPNRSKCHSKNTKKNLRFTLMITLFSVVKRQIWKQNRFCNNHFLKEKKLSYLVVNSSTKKSEKEKVNENERRYKRCIVLNRSESSDKLFGSEEIHKSASSLWNEIVIIWCNNKSYIVWFVMRRWKRHVRREIKQNDRAHYSLLNSRWHQR